MCASVCVCGRMWACLVKHRACREANRETQAAGELAMGELTISLRRTCRIRNILRVGYQNRERKSAMEMVNRWHLIG